MGVGRTKRRFRKRKIPPSLKHVGIWNNDLFTKKVDEVEYIVFVKDSIEDMSKRIRVPSRVVEVAVFLMIKYL